MSIQRNRIIAPGNASVAFSAFLLALGLQPPDAQAQSWKSAYVSPTATGDCSGLDSALRTGFAVDTLVSRAKFGTGFVRPMKMAFDLRDSSQPADIYITQKYGEIQYYDAQAKTLTQIGKVPGVWRFFQEDGLGGIALDPDFKVNRRIYVSYSYRGGDTTTTEAAAQSEPSSTVGLRVSRFTLDPVTRMVDTGSHKLVIHIPAAMGQRYHTGGSLRFDNFGNLYISVGDNESLFMGPGNTADLRGGILRIIPGENGGYSIPEGNFGRYWGQVWEDSGLINRAIEYYDEAKVRPEIYIKGSRNPYVFGLDPNVEGRIAWAECGPDNQRREEQNITDVPVFGGFPFWVGDTTRQKTFDATYNETGDVNSTLLYGQYNDPAFVTFARPVNAWPAATGVDTLPPMHVPASQWGGSQVGPPPVGSGNGNTCAMGGPIIRYDSRITYSGKMPPHLDHTMLWGDFMGQRYWMMKIDSATGSATGPVTEVFPSTAYTRSANATTHQPSIGRHIDLQQGPDGALYLLNHGAGCCNGNNNGSSYMGIIRIRYTGTCADGALHPVTSLRRPDRPDRPSWLKVRAGSFSVRTQGHHLVRILDLNGREVHRVSGEGPRDYALPGLPAGRIYVLRAESPRGTLARMLGRP